MRDVMTAVDGVDVRALRVHLVADPGVHEQACRPVLDEKRPRRELDPVTRVRCRPALPQRLRHHAEHGAAVEPEICIKKRRQLQIADMDRRLHFEGSSCFSSTSTPWVLDGWMKA